MTPWERNAANLSASLSFYGSWQEQRGLRLIVSPVPFSIFNIVLLTSSVTDWSRDLEERIEFASAFYHARQRPWSFWVCENWLSPQALRKLNRTFSAHGFEPIAEPPGMEADDLPPARRPLPRLQVRPVSDATTRRDFSYLVSQCFNIPIDTAHQIYDNEAMWNSPLKAFVGYEDGLAVTCSAAIEAGGALGIYSVATLFSHRGRGLAESIMREVIRIMRDAGSHGPLVLQSSPAGLELYRKLGFRRTTRYFVYSTV